MSRDSSKHDIFERLTSFERKDLTLDELVEIASELLEGLAPKQTRYKVTERPDVRTIRYYTSQGLLPPPEGYSGGRARYSARHLARLLLIKKLQAEHHTLAKIKKLLRDASDEEVLRALSPFAEGAKRAAKHHEPPRPRDEVASAEPALETMKRVKLPHGCTLDIPQSVLSDTNQISELVAALDGAARRLEGEAQ